MLLGIKDDFNVCSIPTKQAKPWILKKHYASRIPPICHSFGLYRNNEIVGVCTFGQGARAFEEKWDSVEVCELNRLITEDNLPKNALSYFVSRTLKMLPSPMLIVSYADPNKGHHGYIYQATNWIYVGLTNKRRKFINENGEQIHERTMVSRYGSASKEVAQKNNIEIKKQKGKHKYFYIIGNKKEKKKIKNIINIKPKPYPKGDNEKYDTGDKVVKQQRLF